MEIDGHTSSGNRGVSCGRIEGQTDANLIVAFRNFSKASGKLINYNKSKLFIPSATEKKRKSFLRYLQQVGFILCSPVEPLITDTN